MEYRKFFMLQYNAHLDYHKAFFNFLQDLCYNCAKGHAIGEVWETVKDIQVNKIWSLDEADKRKFDELLCILSDNQEVEIEFWSNLPKQKAVIRWNASASFPEIHLK